MKRFFVVVITTLLLSLMASRAHDAKGKQANGIWIFYPIAIVQILYAIVAALGCSLAVLGWRQSPKDHVVIAGGIIFIIFDLTTWPKAVRTSHLGIRQRSWYGAWKTIDWRDIREIKKKPDNSLVILGTASKIYFSPYHAGRDTLLQQLQLHENRFTHPSSPQKP